MAANKEGRLQAAVNLLNELNDASEKVKMKALKKLRTDHMAELGRKHIKEICKKLGDSSASVRFFTAETILMIDQVCMDLIDDELAIAVDFEKRLGEHQSKDDRIRELEKYIEDLETRKVTGLDIMPLMGRIGDENTLLHMKATEALSYVPLQVMGSVLIECLSHPGQRWIARLIALRLLRQLPDQAPELLEINWELLSGMLTDEDENINVIHVSAQALKDLLEMQVLLARGQVRGRRALLSHGRVQVQPAQDLGVGGLP